MLFELRNSVPEVSDAWIPGRDLFLAGKVRAAWKFACDMRGKGRLTTANDFILNVEIARACGILKPYLALVRMAHEAFPDDPYVQMYYSRMLQTRGRHVAALEYLRDQVGTLGKSHRGLWGAQLANLYADAGFAQSCQKWLGRMQDEPLFDSPQALYARTCAQDGMRQWDEAIRLAEYTVESAPNWTRARVHLVNCLLARGRVTDAQTQINVVRHLGFEESFIDFSAAMLHCALGDFENSAAELQQCTENWPDAYFTPWARRMLYVLHVENGRLEDAREVASECKKELGLPAIDEVEPGRPHKFIPIPLIAQGTSQCVPTTVAMATYPQGRRLDPELLYREMQGRDGTPLWRMREWSLANGLQFVPVRLEKEAIVGLLDRGIPLIGTLEGPFNSHVDVICGHHDGLKVFYVRDPAHWSPMILPYEQCLERYALHDGVLAIIDSNDEVAIEFARQWRSDGLEALLDLEQAVATGNQSDAETAAARISDDSILSYHRDAAGLNVTISPSRYATRMEALARDTDANGIARIRAMMGLDSEIVDSIVQDVLDSETDKIGNHARLYIEMLRNSRQGNWELAHRQIERLLMRGCGVSTFWSTKSDLLSELGRQEESKRALELALELSPENLYLRERALSQKFNNLTYREYVAEIDAMIAEYPKEPRLLWGRVNVLQDGPDGLAYEKAIREHLGWFPRDIQAYGNLANWYLRQQRQDLSDAVIAEAKALMPDSFDSIEESEQKESEKDSKTATTELPEQAVELGSLLWDLEDPRRDAALEKLTELDEAGKLKWAEQSHLVAMRIGCGAGGKQPDLDAVKALLPKETQGPTYWYANGLLETVSRFNLNAKNAQAVIDWLDEFAPEFRKYVNLWFNRIVTLELTQATEKALRELESLLQKYPAYSSALYRMGVLKYQQSDLSGAAKYLLRAQEVNPGLYGAMDMLANVYESMGKQDRRIDQLTRLRRKLPYCYVCIRDETVAIAEARGHEAAQGNVQEFASCYRPLHGRLLQIRLATKENPQMAEDLMADMIASEDYQSESTDGDELYEEVLQMRMTLALNKEDPATVDALCAEGLARWPDSTRLKLLRAEYGEAERVPLLREVLVSGDADVATAYRYLVEHRQPFEELVADLLANTAPEHQQLLAELFSEVTTTAELLHGNFSYLKWSVERFPDSTTLKYRLAEHCSVSGLHSQAAQLAYELHKSDPSNVELTRFYGRVLIDENPKEALRYLEQACSVNGSVAYLFDLARCYQAAGQADNSRDTHLSILQQNPYVGASVTNLFFLSGEPTMLWPLAKEIVKRGDGVEDEYFLAAAVKLAIATKDTMPAEWIGLAKERQQVLQTRPAFADESELLRDAIKVWEKMRPEQGKKPGWIRKLVLDFGWPGTSWIPSA